MKHKRSMEIIIEQFEMARVCIALRKRGWHLSRACGYKNTVKVKFVDVSEDDKWRKELIKKLDSKWISA